MILIDRNETDPYFNIAAEEYVLREMDEDVFMLWRSRPSVIIGKHQVAAAEADLIFTVENNIPLIRRISGGGTVYHDEGNLNYSLITKGVRGKLVDYKKYSGTVIRALTPYSIDASLEGKSSLVVNGLKFSGNAEHIFRDRVLHHGTLLFNSDLETLRKCIRPDHRDYIDRSIRSKDSMITNLKEHLGNNTSMKDFRKIMLQQVRVDFPGISDYTFNDHDRKMIRHLANDKYQSIEWNFGYSPSYELNKEIILGGERYTMAMKTEKGNIKEIIFFHQGVEALQDISKQLKNCLHHPEAISEKLKSVILSRYLAPPFHRAFIYSLF
ncbi:MAG: lipoate--protein ligase [Bacteroidota bacterium]